VDELAAGHTVELDQSKYSRGRKRRAVHVAMDHGDAGQRAFQWNLDPLVKLRQTALAVHASWRVGYLARGTACAEQSPVIAQLAEHPLPGDTHGVQVLEWKVTLDGLRIRD
jgi:hypothetical protein